MCRIFALRSNQPTRVAWSLLTAPHSLQRQSGCDRRGKCHDSGWGIGYYRRKRPARVRSALPAQKDPHYAEVAGSVIARAVVAHVRMASTGTIAEVNSAE